MNRTKSDLKVYILLKTTTDFFQKVKSLPMIYLEIKNAVTEM